MTMRYAEGFVLFGPATAIVVENKEDARRIISHFITRGYAFACDGAEGERVIYLLDSYDLDRIRKRFPDISFDIWS